MQNERKKRKKEWRSKEKKYPFIKTPNLNFSLRFKFRSSGSSFFSQKCCKSKQTLLRAIGKKKKVLSKIPFSCNCSWELSSSYVKHVPCYVIFQDVFSMIKGQASRASSLFYTWKKQCTEISIREEIDSQYIRLKRQGKPVGLMHCIQIQTCLGALNIQVQIFEGWIMPEAWYQVWCPGLTSMADLTPSCLVILKNSKSLLNPHLLTLWPTWEVSEIIFLETILPSDNSNTRQPWLLTGGFNFSHCGSGVGNLNQSLQTTHTGLLPEEDSDTTGTCWTQRTSKRTMDPKCCQCQSQSFSTFTKSDPAGSVLSSSH